MARMAKHREQRRANLQHCTDEKTLTEMDKRKEDVEEGHAQVKCECCVAEKEDNNSQGV